MTKLMLSGYISAVGLLTAVQLGLLPEWLLQNGLTYMSIVALTTIAQFLLYHFGLPSPRGWRERRVLQRANNNHRGQLLALAMSHITGDIQRGKFDFSSRDTQRI